MPGNYQVLETWTKNPTAGDTVTYSCTFSCVLYLSSFIHSLPRLVSAKSVSLPDTRGLYVHEEMQFSTRCCQMSGINQLL